MADIAAPKALPKRRGCLVALLLLVAVIYLVGRPEGGAETFKELSAEEQEKVRTALQFCDTNQGGSYGIDAGCYEAGTTGISEAAVEDARMRAAIEGQDFVYGDE